ncbi:hypothetical protein T4B_12002, partial [Trichinella pseudospiralis]
LKMTALISDGNCLKLHLSSSFMNKKLLQHSLIHLPQAISNISACEHNASSTFLNIFMTYKLLVKFYKTNVWRRLFAVPKLLATSKTWYMITYQLYFNIPSRNG